MSNMEYWKGYAIRLNVPEDKQTWEEQVKWLQSIDLHFEDLDIEDKWYDMEESDCVLVGEDWYKVTKTQYDPDNINNFEKKDNYIEFTTSFYNGGTYLEEVLRDGITRVSKDS